MYGTLCSVLVGANVLLGAGAPIRAYIDAVGYAACVYANESTPSSLAIPSLSLTNGKDTILIVGADDAVLEKVSASHPSAIHGAYHNIISAEGVSALWNGYVGSASAATAPSEIPSVVVSGLKVTQVSPFNLIQPTKRVVFYSKGAAEATLTEEEAVNR